MSSGRRDIPLSLMNKGKVSDESLNLGGLADLLSVLLVFTVNDVLADIILLGEVEELADVGGSLGTKTAGLSRGGVGKSGNILLTLLDDHEVEDSKIGTDDAATDGLALTLTLRDRRDKRRGNTARRAR